MSGRTLELYLGGILEEIFVVIRKKNSWENFIQNVEVSKGFSSNINGLMNCKYCIFK